jgi:hypothetical protein
VEEEAVDARDGARQGVVELPQGGAERVGDAVLAVARHRAGLAHVHLLAERPRDRDLAAVAPDGVARLGVAEEVAQVYQPSRVCCDDS